MKSYESSRNATSYLSILLHPQTLIVCLSVCLCICLSVCLSVCLCLWLCHARSLSSSLPLSVYVSRCLFVFFTHTFTHSLSLSLAPNPSSGIFSKWFLRVLGIHCNMYILHCIRFEAELFQDGTDELLPGMLSELLFDEDRGWIITDFNSGLDGNCVAACLPEAN